MPILSANTEAILLLTGPLMLGGKSSAPDLLRAGEYRRLAQRLRDIGREPADLLGPDADEIIRECDTIAEPDRLHRLLGRGFQLSQAVERWRSRAIWAVSRADPEYPRRLKTRLRGDAPPILYGCGDPLALDQGGLAVVGSRHVDDVLVDYTIAIGQLAARTGRTMISGGARGVDQAAMRGAMDANGRVVGVLADGLEKQVVQREQRDMVLDGRLTLVSPYDPSAGFNVGNAMQRNKLIYALSDAALVVSSDLDKGGTWTGAVEQLDKLRLVPLYVRASGTSSPGLDALRRKGAAAWPEPDNAEALDLLLTSPGEPSQQRELAWALDGVEEESLTPSIDEKVATTPDLPASPDEKLFGEAGRLIERIAETPVRDRDVAIALRLEPSQAKAWLNRLVEQGRLRKTKSPVRYVAQERTLL